MDERLAFKPKKRPLELSSSGLLAQWRCRLGNWSLFMAKYRDIEPVNPAEAAASSAGTKCSDVQPLSWDGVRARKRFSWRQANRTQSADSTSVFIRDEQKENNVCDRAEAVVSRYADRFKIANIDASVTMVVVMVFIAMLVTVMLVIVTVVTMSSCY